VGYHSQIGGNTLKRLIPLFVLAIPLLAWATLFTGDYADMRPAGSVTISGTNIYQICDSTDTFQVDTFKSDTIVIDTSTTWVNYCFEYLSEAQADSANDSINIIVLTYTSYNLGMKRLVDTDTFGLSATGPAVGDTIWSNLHVDTLVLTRLWFETIMMDSFIMGAGIDTNVIGLRYQVLQKD
jgi:hypothetical protein